MTTGEERDEALRRLREALGARREVPLDEARPLPMRRLDTPAARDPSYVAQPFFAGPVRAERPWIQPLVAAGLSLTLAGSLLALPLIGGGLSRSPESGLALPADVPGDMVEVDVPPQPSDEGTVIEPPPTPPGAGATEEAPATPAPVPPTDTDGASADDILLPTIPPFPPVPDVPPGDRASGSPPPQQQPPAGPPGPPIAGPIPGSPGDDAADEEPPNEEPPHEGEQPPDGGNQGEQPPSLDEDESEGYDGDEGSEDGDDGLPPGKEDDEDTGDPEAS